MVDLSPPYVPAADIAAESPRPSRQGIVAFFTASRSGRSAWCWCW